VQGELLVLLADLRRGGRQPAHRWIAQEHDDVTDLGVAALDAGRRQCHGGERVRRQRVGQLHAALDPWLGLGRARVGADTPHGQQEPEGDGAPDLERCTVCGDHQEEQSAFRGSALHHA